MLKRLGIVITVAALVIGAAVASAQARGHRAQPVVSSWSFGGSLVDKARGYIGTNPTGWSSLWCGRFMAMIAPDAAARVRNPNMARDWLALQHVSVQVGAIAVLRRGRGGHVGVVTAIDANGNPTVVSGNHNRVVGEGTYPKGRVIAYVSP